MRDVHLITGGNGFLGNLIAQRLLAEGKRVRVLDIWDAPDRNNDIEFINGSVLDRDTVAKSLKDVSVVHHNAALVPLTRSNYHEVNCEGSRIVAEEAVQAGVDAFVFMSSSAIYGMHKEQITENTTNQPFEAYGKSKFAGEKAVREVCERNGLMMISIRPRTILGDGRLGIFQILFEWMSENRKIYLLGDGNELFQFVHASDLIDFYMLALQLEKSGNYNVGAAEYGTMRGDIERLIAEVGSSSRVVSLPRWPAKLCLELLYLLNLSPLTPWHYRSLGNPYHFDVKPLLELGWQPKYSNQTMLLESYRWFEENRDKIKVDKSVSPHRSAVQQKMLNILRKIS